MLIPFVKMHAQGNDFVIVDGYANKMPKLDFPALAIDACAPHTGIGADGLVLIVPSKTAGAQMIIYNSDGSRAEMCGSALRCVSWLTHKRLKQTNVRILTDSGIKFAELSFDGSRVAVNLGHPQLVESSLAVNGFTGDLVDVGNLHYVVWADSLDDNPHLLHGPSLEHNKAFPHPVNSHFALLHSSSEIDIKIWEHACGATLACGTGATSCVFSGIQRGLLSGIVKVNMPGGSVQLEVKDSGYILSGEVSLSFSGVYPWKT